MANYNFDFSLLDLNFNYSNSHDNKKTVKLVNQCFLCNKLRRTFYCKQCIKNGDFIHSTSRFSERFAEKRLRLLQKQHEKDTISNNYDNKLYKPRLIENKMEDIQLCKDRIKMLQLLIQQTLDQIETRKKTLSDLKDFNNQKKQNIRKNKECHDQQKVSIQIISKKKTAVLEELNTLNPVLKTVTCQRIRELVEYIFPISEVPHSKRSDSLEELQNETAETARNSRASGKWVFIDSWRESHHSIVAPTLPDSGDYFTYLQVLVLCFSVSKRNEPGTPSTNSVEASCNPAYNISAAFTYITQLVNILAFYLDVRLPNRLTYREFCEKQLNERKLIKCITYLNANVLFLCLTQNVDPDILNPMQTLCNILLLLDTKKSDLGRQSAAVSNQCISYFEDQLNSAFREALKLNADLEADDDKEVKFENDDDQNDMYDSDSLTVDWEALPLVPCPEAVPGLSNVSAIQTTSSVTTGLMTSAAAGLASIWRGFVYK